MKALARLTIDGKVSREWERQIAAIARIPEA
jgi:hypothetical protein